MSGDRPDANLDAVRHLRCDLIGDRDANQWECRLIDGDGRILATLTGTAVFDLRFIDDHDPDAVTFTFTAPVLPPWPLPRRDEEPDADLLSVPDAFDIALAAARAGPPGVQFDQPGATTGATPTVPTGEWQREHHERDRPFLHAHVHTHRARNTLTHSHPHTHGKRERVAGEHRGGDHHGNPRAPDPTGGAQPDDPAEP